MRNNKKKALTKRSTTIAGLTSTLILLTSQVAFADKLTNAANKASSGFHATALSIGKPLVIIVVVVAALVMLTGSQRQKEGVKDSARDKVIGIALLVLAIPIAGIIFGWFE